LSDAQEWAAEEVVMAKRYGIWEVAKSLGEGGQAHTFLVKNVEDQELPLHVLKRLKNYHRLGRFKDEVRACITLNHHNVLKVVDHDLTGERPYLVTPHCVKGCLTMENLHAFDVLGRVALFKKICEGIAHAHAIRPHQIIHRDIKPENIFLDADDNPVVGDFGICHIDDSGDRQTMTSEAVGARNFMAPELEDGRVDDVSPASDVYSLGKLLYWMLAGRIFSREKHREKVFDLRRDRIPPAMSLVYELLDKTVVESIEKRLGDGEKLLGELEVLVHRLRTNAHCIDFDETQLCSFCGYGYYRPRVDYNPHVERGTAHTVQNFGFGAVGGAVWLILVCEHCGHVQSFRPDHARNGGHWKNLYD
jgi:serine/threonine protein kinase